MKAYIPGIVILAVAIILFWASTRKTLSERARMFLEGQATVAVPAGLAALGVGAWTTKDAKKNGQG